MKSRQIYSPILFIVLSILFPLIISSCLDNEVGGGQSIKKEKISGFVQKGPFVSGTSILMSELNAELGQTGKVFTSQIANDQGLFEITNIELNSSFVEFSSTGFYFNEVTGEISSAPITLTSLADLSNKSSINVNVLTHLEKKRVETLIKNGKSFSESKKQAKNEILSIFSSVLVSNSDFEDYDLSKNTEEGGVLLSSSIILQGKRSVGQLTELLSKIQNDFASDGKLDDASIINSLRVSTFELDLVAIRANIETRNKALNITSTIPDFEKYINKFLELRDLKITTEGEGTVSEEIISNPSGREYLKGTTVRLVPIPNEGWIFEGWAGDLTGMENPKTILIDSPTSITAKFKRRNYPLSITIVGEGTVTEEIVFSPSGREYPFQTEIEITPIPKIGWRFMWWEGDISGFDSPVRIVVDKEKTVKAKFGRKQYPVDYIINGSGRIDTVQLAIPEHSYNYTDSIGFSSYETEITIKATPENGYVFKQWGGDISGSENPTNIVVKGAMKIEANFIENPNFYLGHNGTTCFCPYATEGEKGIINGVIYEAVTNESIKSKVGLISEGYQLCTSLVTNMSYLFGSDGGEINGITGFNRDISSWDVSRVTDMTGMFSMSDFNHSIEEWDVGNVERMDFMFSYSKFKGNVNGWNVSSVKSMKGMFSLTSYNLPLNQWDVSSVEDMSKMFEESGFNQPIGNWNVSKVKKMSNMFFGARFFNQPINNWDVGNVIDMSQMFAGLTEFDNRNPFNQSIESWDVRSVIDMSSMFRFSDFDHPLNNWNVSNVESMFRMFDHSRFNQPIGNWNVRRVKNMDEMFFYALYFNQDLSTWCVINITSIPLGFLDGTALWEFPKPIWGTCPI